MATTETNVENLKINTLTSAQYATIDPSNTELYLIVDDALTSSDITTALGFTPYNSTNPSGYQANVIETVKVNGTALTPSSKAVNITVPAAAGAGNLTIKRNGTAIGTFGANQTTNIAVDITVATAVSELTNDSGFITGISSSDVTTALGYTPYSNANPSGYQANVLETVKVNGTALTATSKTVDITVPAAAGTGNLTIKRNGTAIGTFNANATSNTSVDVTVPTKVSELTNDSSFISGITSSDVTTALGYTPYSNANPSGYQANVLETVKVNGTALTATSKTVDITIPAAQTIGNGNMVIQRNGSSVGTFTANQTAASTINISVPTTASDVGALPSSTTIGNGNMVIKRNNTAIGTFTANQTTASTINISVPTTASDVGALPDTTSIPSVDQAYSATSTNAQSGTAVAGAISGLIKKTDLSIASASANYLTYNNSNGQFGAKVDTTVTSASTNLITSGAVEAAIAAAIVGGVIYRGTWTATSQTSYSSITLPVKKGYLYYVTGSATVDGIEWNTGDFLLINEDVAVGGSLTSAKLSKIDNTEGADIVRLNATQTLTNKTIDADSNSISNLTTSNLKSGVLSTAVRATSSASNTVIVSEKGIAAALASKYDSSNPSGYQANVLETVKVNGTALTATSKTVNITIPAQQTVGNGNMVIQRNSTAIGTFTANQTTASTINISVPTTASDVGALPSSTTIGNGNMVIQRNSTAIGTFTANQTAASTINISVPTTAAEVGAQSVLTAGTGITISNNTISASSSSVSIVRWTA